MSAQPERFCSHFCKRLVGMVLLAGIVTFLSPLAARAATIASPPIGSWNAGSALSQPRAGGCATLLQDGRILVIGGDNGFGPSPSVDFVSGTDGSISPAPPLLVARERHVCVTLQDGRVLVAGGAVSGGGVTNEAEVYDPIANSWSTVAGSMVETRSRATATLLQNGNVLITGGVGNSGAASSTAEIFDPKSPGDGNSNAFALAGNLSSARENHAAALLNDGRVLIVGGSDGTTALATSDIYDPSAATIKPGPAMATARQALSATTLLNGLVLAVGGNNGQDLASVELFDASANSGAGGFAAALDGTGKAVSLVTARQGHQAVSLPHNGAVLIVGGTSAGAAQSSAELFTSTISSTGVWTYAEAATGSMTAVRANFTATALSDGTPQSTNDGLLLAVGGTDALGNTLSSTEVYSFPWVKSDQVDYAPGSSATITGGGFQPAETVQMSLVESPLGDNDGPPTAVADANGNISAQFVVDSQDAGVRFYLTAIGQSSGRQAQITFTDYDNGGGGSSGGGSTPAAKLTVTKTNNVSGSTTPNNPWTWSITVANTGNAQAKWTSDPTNPAASLILQDALPNSNITYGGVSGAPSGVTCAIDGSATLICSIPPCNGINCPFYILGYTGQSGNPATSFTISFTATASVTGTYANPRSGGFCVANPSNANTAGTPSCSDTVTVSNATTFTLNYTAGTGGTISGTSPQTVNSGGNGTQVTAVPNTGYTFQGWSDGVATASRTDTNVTKNITVTANFVVQTFTLTYMAGAGGTISGTSPQTVNSGGNGTQVTAVPNTGYTFQGWSDGVATASRTDTSVTKNTTVMANFVQTFTLTYTAGAGGMISGTSPQTVNSGGSGTQVTAVPNTGYTFQGWSDGVATASRTDTNVTKNITVMANFVQTFTLTYTAGAGGTISGTSPQTVNSGGSGAQVTAIPNAGYAFVQWSDGKTAASRTDTNVTANINVTATFVQTFTLTYTAGAGGMISGTSPQTVNSGGSGTPVTAVANPGYVFVQWSDGLTTAPRTDTNVTKNITVNATFIQIFTLTYTTSAGGAIIGTSPQTVKFGGSGTIVTASPNVGYHFMNWSDGVITAARTDTNVATNINVTAYFAPNTTTTIANVKPLYYKVSNGSTSATNPPPANCATATPACQQYSDPLLLQATVTPVGTGTLAGTVTFKIGTSLLSATTVVSGVSLADAASGKQIAITLPPNSGYNVYAVFTSSNAYFPSSDNSASPPHLAVTQEDAQLTYTGQQYFTTSSTATSMSVTVVFTLQDASATCPSTICDPYPGDITKAVAQLVLNGIAPTGSFGTCNPSVVAVSGEVGSNGLPSAATFTCTFNNVPVPGAFNLTASGTGGSYYSFLGDTSMAITTANGGTGFITGGGFQTAAYLGTPNTATGKYTNGGFLAPAPGTKVNFGFQASSKKNTQLTGGVNLIIRSQCLTNIAGYTGKPGDDHLCVYQIKVSNGQLQSVSENLTSTPAYAQLTGNAIIQDVTWPNPVSVGGKVSLILQMYDVAEPGANADTLAIQLTDSTYGLWMSSNWSGTKTVINTTAPQIQGGNLQVH